MFYKGLRLDNGNQKQRRWNYAENICSVFNINHLDGAVDHDGVHGLHKKYKPGR